MPQVEFGSLYKFIASIGLFLVIAAVTLPWLLLQSTEVLLISSKTIDTLPSSASRAIERRQELVAWAQDHLPLPTFLILAAVGILMLVWALFKWTPSQNRADANDQIELQKKQFEYKILSSDEKEEKLEAEVADSIPAPREGHEPGATDTDTTASLEHNSVTHVRAPSEADSPIASPESSRTEDPDSGRQEETPTDLRAQTRKLVSQLRATEDQIARLFREAFEGPFNVERDVRITSGVARGGALDILLEPHDSSRAQLGIEIVRFGSQVMRDRLSTWLTRAAITTQDLAAGRVFTGARGRPREAKASGIVVLVLDREGLNANALRIQRDTPIINSAMKRPIGMIIVAQERLPGITAAELRDAVASAWAEPDVIVTLE